MLPLLKNPCATFGVADLKQTDCQSLLQQKEGFIQDQQRNATGSLQPVKVPKQQGKEDAFIEGKRKLGGLSKQRVPGFSLAESLPGKKRRLSFSCWALLSSQGMRAPLSSLPTLLN